MYWPLQENVISKSEKKRLTKFITKAERYTQFKEVYKFEKAFSKWQGCKFSVFVNSGSSANLLIIQSAKELYGWKDKDEIIVPSLTWPTTVTPVIQSNLKPIFVDCNLKDFSFNYESLRKHINKKTKAIFVAHIIGFPSNIPLIKKIIGNKKIIILEDSCESQGAKINNKKVGNFGIASSFSFYWGHHMTTIEGGMICTNNEKFYQTCLLKRSHGLARELPKKMHNKIKKKYQSIDFKFLFLSDGYNFRSTEINAILGRFQLKKINKFINIRNKNYKLFYNLCNEFKNYFITTKTKGMSSFVLQVVLKNKNTANKLKKTLNYYGIETRPFIAGNLLKQPFLKNYAKKKLPNADFINNNSFYIGNNQFVNSNRIKKIRRIFYNFFNEEN